MAMSNELLQRNDSIFATTAFDLKNEESYLTTGCSKFDQFLRGGIPKKGILQIYGESGIGKTQLALQLCLTVQVPESEGGAAAAAVYICTEDTFPSRRLQELLTQSQLSKKCCTTGDSIFVEHVATMEELEVCVIQKIPLLINSRKIGLLVIDSIAAPYRAEYNDNELKKRAKSLRSIGHQLHKFGSDYTISVVCINQVSAVIGSNIQEDIHKKQQPTLGIIWAGMITNSLQLYRQGKRRYACMVVSPYLPRNVLEFRITSAGVTGIT
ncbi:DNA repair protein XRCC3 [Cephus cinctus]|uniref:DNA repair protein XRCC3 n=1 Tax=Cephus cinctus TaxID=211228 RepID=A0AAJ7FLU9_CEPCN|nr:DNA repair protein XRCC3 [Cephus cinctus]XP_015598188.1 DNA repair protein XRCC3 [Cephus cinctus]XP_015598197.1 DNA repair protein XRCC3 [Cephus cinctus]